MKKLNSRLQRESYIFPILPPSPIPSKAVDILLEGENSPLHKQRLDLNKNSLYIPSCNDVSRQRIFHMDVKLRMHKYCYSNKGDMYAKGRFTEQAR